jgi:hypothetical protein
MMDDNGRLVVTKLVSGQYQGWLDPDVWKWVNPRSSERSIDRAWNTVLD